MFGITEKYNQFKNSTYFAGTKFVIYSFGIYLAATFTVGCLGLIIGSPLLMMPLAILISNPVVWVLIGVVLTAAYKMAVEPLFHLVKDYVNGKKASNEEKSEEKDIKLQALQKPTLENPERSITPVTPDRPKTPDNDTDSDVIILEDNEDSGDINSNNEDNKPDFAEKTNKGDYKCWLTDFNIGDVARIVYGYSPDGIKNDVFFTSYIADQYPQQIKVQLEKYKQKAGKNHNLIFTATLHLRDKKHFVTLVVSHDEKSKKFTAYYCDSFGKPLPDEISDVLNNTLKIDKSAIGSSKEKQQTDGHNCGIFALENAKIITDALKAGKSFSEIDKKLSEYNPSPEELENKRKEFAKALEKDEQSIVSVPSERNSRSSDVSLVSSVSLDSGISVGEKEFCENWPTLVHQTNHGNYIHLLEQHDIAYIARIKYGYSEASINDVFFSIPGDVNSLNERLKEYKNKTEKANSQKTFTSVVNLGNYHWVTLVVSYEPTNKQFIAYYCDSFGNQLPSDSDKLNDIKLANKITEQQISPLTNKISDLIAESEVNPDSAEVEEHKKNMKEALRCVREDKSKLVNKEINVYYIAAVLQETLGINDIRSSKTKQQSDGYNCGIFALENARRITQMLSEGKSFDEVDEKLSKNIPNKEELMEKRQEFTRALMNDEEWKGDIAEDGILHDTIQQLILERNGGKNESVITNIALIGTAAASVNTLGLNN